MIFLHVYFCKENKCYWKSLFKIYEVPNNNCTTYEQKKMFLNIHLFYIFSWKIPKHFCLNTDAFLCAILLLSNTVK